MPMKTLGTVRDKDNRHLSRIEVVMVHELMEGKGEGSEFCVYCRGVSNRRNNELKVNWHSKAEERGSYS